jgi:hypothetical protein
MTEGNYTYQVESYCLMTQADASVLLLNPVLEKYGYAFLSVRIEELEKSFSDLVGLKPPYPERGRVNLMNLQASVSNQFYETIQHHPLFGHHFLQHGYVILLKKINDYTRVVVNHALDINDSAGSTNDMQVFCTALVAQLRLIKNCHLDFLLQFHVARDTRTVVVRHVGFSRKEFSVAELHLTSEEVEQFGKEFQGRLEPNELSGIAYQTFMLSHDIVDIKTEYILLMTALESIFNVGSDQISHTVARHLAMILASNQADFEWHYRAIKKLYGTRSKMVHGEPIKTDLTIQVQQLKAYVRKALQFTLARQQSKIELFDCLNAMGLPDK